MTELSFQTFSRLCLMLKELYDLSSVADLRSSSGGYTTENFLFSDADKTFFLKRYNTTETARIHDIVTAYERFFQRGIPVIRPFHNHLGESCFFLDNAWWAVFPFIEGVIRPSETLTTNDFQALGSFLGELHRVGQSCQYDDIQHIALWNRDIFRSEQHLLEYTYHQEATPREAASLAFQNIVIQKQFLDEHADFIERIPPPNDCLIHGDFTHNNVFFRPEGGIMATFDLDKACVAPRAYELARSTLIICFDRTWDERSFEQAHVFLRAYLTIHPMTFEDFRAGLHMYIANYMHMTWLERKVILDKSARHEQLLRSSHVRLTHLVKEFSTLAERLFPQ